MHHNGLNKIFTNHDWYKLVKTNTYQSLLIHNYLSCLCTYFLINFVSEVLTIKVAIKENSCKWILQRDKLLQCWIFRKISDVPQRFILGPLFFLIHINNLSNNIVALAIKHSYVHTHVCSYISETWIENPQIQLKMSFLISYIGKIYTFPKFSVVVYELWL